MNLVLVGLNHKTASVDLREKLAGLLTDLDAAYQHLRKQPAMAELVLYATCNRVESLCATEEPDAAIAHFRAFFVGHKVPPGDLEASLYIHRDRDAVQHLFRVAASLDSLVVGEPQILGQIKEAYRQATRHQATGPILNRLLHKTFSVAKRVRRETGIGDHAVSISYAAVTLGRKIFGSLAGKTAVLVGAGEMAELALEHLKSDGVGRIIVANRTLERGRELARQLGGEAITLSELPSELQRPDIVISSTGAPHAIFRPEHGQAFLHRRRNRPMFFIDIAVPRNLDPAIGGIGNVFLYNIDDLKEVVETNWQRRQQEAVKAERLVAAETLKFQEWLATLQVFPTIIALKEKADRICEAELERTMKQLGPLTEEQRQALEVLTQSITQKLLHDPIIFLKGYHHPQRPTRELDTVRRLFNLDPDRDAELTEED